MCKSWGVYIIGFTHLMFLGKPRHKSPAGDTSGYDFRVAEKNFCNDLNMQRDAGHTEEGFYHQAASDWDVQYNRNIAMIEFQIPNTWSSSGDNSLSTLLYKLYS